MKKSEIEHEFYDRLQSIEAAANDNAYHIKKLNKYILNVRRKKFYTILGGGAIATAILGPALTFLVSYPITAIATTLISLLTAFGFDLATWNQIPESNLGLLEELLEYHSGYYFKKEKAAVLETILQKINDVNIDDSKSEFVCDKNNKWNDEKEKELCSLYSFLESLTEEYGISKADIFGDKLNNSDHFVIGSFFAFLFQIPISIALSMLINPLILIFSTIVFTGIFPFVETIGLKKENNYKQELSARYNIKDNDDLSYTEDKIEEIENKIIKLELEKIEAKYNVTIFDNNEIEEKNKNLAATVSKEFILENNEDKNIEYDTNLYKMKKL